jgi:hypothetical protein
VAAGGDAALAIIDALPGGRALRPWAALPPVRALARLAYGWVARHRRAIGRRLGLELGCGLLGAGDRGPVDLAGHIGADAPGAAQASNRRPM